VDGKLIKGGAFSVARKIYNSNIWQRPPLSLKIWLWILGRANYSNLEKNGKKYQRGELMTTHEEIIRSNGHYHNRQHILPTKKQIRLILQWLQNEGMICVIPVPQEPCRTGANTEARAGAYIGLKISIVNYDTYQTLGNYSGRHQDRDTAEPGQDNKKAEMNYNDLSAGLPETLIKRFSEDSIPFQLADRLLKRIQENHPKFKNPNLQKWAAIVDLMIRRDQRDPINIEKMTDWCQADSFWQSNILSTQKLRDKFDQLFMQMNRPKMFSNNNNRTGGPRNSGSSLLDGLENWEIKVDNSN
jgi:hypothetical protein